MHFNDILHWAIAAAKDQAQKAAIAEIQKATGNLNSAIEKHAGDFQSMLQDQLAKTATTAVAAILSKQLK